VAAAALAGCAATLIERKAPEKQRFVLDPEPPPVASAPLEGALRVERVRVAPLFDHKGFVYRTGEDTWASDFYHEFFAPPGDVLREAFLTALEEASLFRSIQRDSLPHPDWSLAIEVERLYGDRRDGGKPVAVLDLEAKLVDSRGAARTVVWNQRYVQMEPVADGSPQALVDAWSRALGRTLATLAEDLRGAVTRAPAARTGRWRPTTG
jgi:uncharacterized lipoprotein YmbA